MALTVPCPECGTKLLAPDSAVGRQLRCPKCGTLTTVPDLLPAQEVEVVEAKAIAPPPKPKPVQAEAADEEDERPAKKSRRDEEDEEEERPRKKNRPRYADDDDYDHDRPRKKKRRRAAGGGGGGSGALVAGVVIVGLLLLAASGFAVYFFFGKGKPTPLVKRAPVPPGWSQFSYPQDGFKVYLPKQPDYTSVPAEFLRRDEAPGGFAAGRGPFGLGRVNVGNDLADAERFTMVQSGTDWRDPVRVELVVFKFRDKVPLAIRERFRTVAREGSVEGVPVRTVLWLGSDALEQSYPNGVLRVMYTDRCFVVAAISGRNGSRAKPEEEAGFFDNIELLD